jgi:hypothetical protein
LAIPDFNRQKLRIIAAYPTPRQVAIFALNTPIVGDLSVNRSSMGATIRVPVADGTFQEILLRPELLSQ